MEKKTAHCKLSKVHALIHQGHVKATFSATTGAANVGVFGLQAMCDVVLSLAPGDLHKSMTTHEDHRIWQDVYHGRTAEGVAVYVKLTVTDGLLIVSFKEK